LTILWFFVLWIHTVPRPPTTMSPSI
jgi:hypothetical protein